MREIKFRAWHRGHSRMYDVRSINSQNGQLTLSCPGYGPGYIIADIKQCNLVQYTGLKDENGKEIYEGDLIQWWDKTAKPEVVEATDGGWNPFIDSCTTDHSYHYVVIGNIHEDKDTATTLKSPPNAPRCMTGASKP